jgi:hypothetical protein
MTHSRGGRGSIDAYTESDPPRTTCRPWRTGLIRTAPVPSPRVASAVRPFPPVSDLPRRPVPREPVYPSGPARTTAASPATLASSPSAGGRRPLTGPSSFEPAVRGRRCHGRRSRSRTCS